MKFETQPFDIETKVRQDCYNRGYEQGRKNPAEEIVKYIEKLQNQVKEYQDKIEQGTLIELPCKVGDMVYSIYKFTDYNPKIKNSSHYEIFESEMSGFFIDKKMIFSEFNKPLVGKGKYVCAFYTREEAESKLKELQE